MKPSNDAESSICAEKDHCDEKSNSVYTEKKIGANTYFHNPITNYAFAFVDDLLRFAGKYKESKDSLEVCAPGEEYNIPIKLQLFVDPAKKNILYFIKDNIVPFQTALFAEGLAKDFNVFVVGEMLYNIVIHGVVYITTSRGVKWFLETHFYPRMERMYFEHVSLFEHLKVDKIPTKKSYVHHHTDLTEEGTCVFKNWDDQIDSYIFFHQDEMDYFCAAQNLQKDARFVISNYPVKSLKIDEGKIKRDPDMPSILCFDKFDECARKIAKLYTKPCKLYVLANKKQDNKGGKITYIPRTHAFFLNCIPICTHFFVGEIGLSTHFNIFLAQMGGLKCVVPQYFHSLPRCKKYRTLEEAARKIDEE